jgi:hypothetical protein
MEAARKNAFAPTQRGPCRPSQTVRGAIERLDLRFLIAGSDAQQLTLPGPAAVSEVPGQRDALCWIAIGGGSLGMGGPGGASSW